jgi:hypothetical protein
MICSNCLEERPDVVPVCEDRNYNACGNCSVTYGKNRYGETFVLDEEVHLKEGGLFTKLVNRLLVIVGIYIFEECESGRMVLMKDKETGKTLKHIFDINWLTKKTNKK